MNIKRFFGKTSREALAQVKQTLGEDAIIIANRSVDGGTEILAVLEAEIDHKTTNTAPKALRQPRSLLDYVNTKDSQVSHKSNPNNETLAQENLPAGVVNTASKNKPEPASASPLSEHTIADLLKQHGEQQEHAYQLATQTLEEKMRGMMLEMREMRSRFESQMNTITWQHHVQHSPAKSKVLSSLLAAGFSASLSRQIAEKLPQHISVSAANQWAKDIVHRNLLTLENEEALLNQGGIYALVGPTGVGKTTTTAKLAARYVMKHGTQNLGLITTDSYRIGGFEQLRIYGKILGVMVHAVKDEEDLKIALSELKNKHMILVDTVGVSQRDHAVTEQLSMLNQAEAPIHKLLCINATSTGDTLTDVFRTYKKYDLCGCVVTKLDEAAAIGNVIDVLVREQIRLFYTTSGQRVPEDIEVANKSALIERVWMPHQASRPYQYLDDELPLVIGNLTQSSRNTELPHA